MLYMYINQSNKSINIDQLLDWLCVEVYILNFKLFANISCIYFGYFYDSFDFYYGSKYF